MFVIIVLDTGVSGGDTLTITVLCTVVLGILAQGLSAVPLARLYRARDGERRQQRSRTIRSR